MTFRQLALRNVARRKVIGGTAGLLSSLISVSVGQAYSDDSARSAVRRFHTLIDGNEIRKIWQELVGRFLRDKVTEEAFVSQLSIFRANFGGAAKDRTLVQQQSGKDPASGLALTSFRFRILYPTASVYEDTTWGDDNNEAKLFGIYFNPAPPS